MDISVSLRNLGGSSPPTDDRTKVHFLYCFVFPTKKTNKKETEEEFQAYRQEVFDKIIAAGLAVECFYSVQKDEVYVKVGASDNRLLYEADLCEHKLELEPSSMSVVARSNKDEERGPICLEKPYDRKQHFASYNYLSQSWQDISDDEIESFMKKQSSLSPFVHLFARYNDEWEVHHKRVNGVQIYKTYADGSILRTATRMKLVQIALERSTKEAGPKDIRGAGLNIGQMVFKKKVLAGFPMQTATATLDSKGLTVEKLFEEWSYFWKFPWTQPLDDIRDYFGEKIAIYFAFLGHYTLWLAPAAIIGFCIFIAQMANVSKNMGSANFFNVSRIEDSRTVVYTDLPISPFFAFFVALWATFMLEFWKRKEARFSLKYGMVGFEDEEIIRPEFQPTHFLPSPVTGKRDPFLSEASILAKITISLSVILSCITVVVAAFAGIFVLKVFVTLPESQDETGLDETNGGYLALVINSITIQLLAFVYKMIAQFLNEFENHKTDTDFEDSLIAKTFVFSFVNSYATLFYMAFIKSNVKILGVAQYCNVRAREENATDACFGDLGTSLFIIFCSQIVVNNSMEVVIPFLMGLISKTMNLRIDPKSMINDEHGKVVPLRSPAEDQFYLQSYEGTIGDFLELALQFGYATLFVTAFPIAPFLAFINNWLEVRVDSFKLCKLCRRPEMKGAEDIGTWQYIFETVSFIAVITNAAVSCFNSNVISDLVRKHKGVITTLDIQEIESLKSEEALLVWLFIIFVLVIMLTKAVVGYLIPDIPGEVTIQIKRNEYLIRKCLLRERDDDDVDDDETGINHEEAEKMKSERRKSLTHNTIIIRDTDPEIEATLAHIARELVKHLNGQPPESLFEKINANKKKGISRQEFRNMLNTHVAAEGMVTWDEISTLVTALDTNSNGYIDPEEFLSLLRRATSSSPTSAST